MFWGEAGAGYLSGSNKVKAWGKGTGRGRAGSCWWTVVPEL